MWPRVIHLRLSMQLGGLHSLEEQAEVIPPDWTRSFWVVIGQERSIAAREEQGALSEVGKTVSVAF